MKFKIYASINTESLEPWIWTNFSAIDSNGFILIRNPTNNKKIKCFKRTIEGNFLRNYNDEGRIRINTDDGNVIVINEYYRKQLNIETQHEYDLDIKKIRFISRLFLNWYHPNLQVQFVNRLTLISILIGLLSLILGIVSIWIIFC